MVKDKDYLASLDKVLNVIFAESDLRHWSWHELADNAGLHPSTVYKIGNRITRLPYFRTVYLLGQAVGLTVMAIKVGGKRRLKAG